MDLIDRKELLKHQTVYYDYNGEKIGVVRVSDIVEAQAVEQPPKVVYLCDRKKECRDSLSCGNDCMHTLDISHAANFVGVGGSFMEVPEPERKTGKWDIEISDDGHQATYRCSECGHRFKWLYDPMFPPVFNYCKNCGARMTNG